VGGVERLWLHNEHAVGSVRSRVYRFYSKAGAALRMDVDLQAIRPKDREVADVEAMLRTLRGGS
jgi:hypothetical protein